MLKKGLGFFFTILFITGCGKSLSEKMRDKKEEVKEILAGEKLTEYGIPESSFAAKDLIDEVIAHNPEDCEANYLLLLTDLKNLIETLDPVLQVVQTLGYSSGTMPLSGGLVDSIVSGIVFPLLDTFNEMDNAVLKIERYRCSILLKKYPIKLGMDTSPIINIYLAGYDPTKDSSIPGEWDIVEAELIGSFVSLVKGVLHYILSIDLDLDIESAMDAINQGVISLQSNPISIIRGVGFAPAKNPNFLKFHSDVERRNYYTLVGKDFATTLRRLSNFLKELYNEQDENPYDDIIAGIDENRDGKVDRLQFNIFDGESGKRGFYINVGGNETDVLSLLELFVSSFITYDYIQNASQIISEMADKFDGSNKTEPIYPSDIEPLLFNIIDLPDVIRFYPWKLFPDNIESAKPPRDLLPYWEDTNGDGFEEFIIEGEVPANYAGSATDYIFVGDSPHFEGLTGPEPITNDCISPQSITLFYIAFQDPSFNGAIEVNLSEIEPNGCSYAEYKNWTPADNFSLNAVINYTINIVAPLIEQFMGSM